MENAKVPIIADSQPSGDDSRFLLLTDVFHVLNMVGDYNIL